MSECSDWSDKRNSHDAQRPPVRRRRSSGRRVIIAGAAVLRDSGCVVGSSSRISLGRWVLRRLGDVCQMCSLFGHEVFNYLWGCAYCTLVLSELRRRGWVWRVCSVGAVMCVFRPRVNLARGDLSIRFGSRLEIADGTFRGGGLRRGDAIGPRHAG